MNNDDAQFKSDFCLYNPEVVCKEAAQEYFENYD